MLTTVVAFSWASVPHPDGGGGVPVVPGRRPGGHRAGAGGGMPHRAAQVPRARAPDDQVLGGHRRGRGHAHREYSTVVAAAAAATTDATT